MRKFEIYRRVLPSVGPIVFRNVFLLVNAVIFLVVLLLFIFGSKGSLSFPSFQFVYGEQLSWTADLRSASLRDMADTLADPLAVQMDHFVSLCEGGCEAPVISIEDGIANQLVCEAIKSSAMQGQLVTLGDE